MNYTNEPVYTRGDWVITTKDIESRPKMSLCLRIPKGSILKVTKVERTDKMEHWRGVASRYMLMCYDFDICPSFPFPVASIGVVHADEINRLLHGNSKAE